MTLVNEYFDLTNKWKNEYGEKTLVLTQVGAFFEVYARLSKTGEMVGSNISDFSNINDMVISRKVTCAGKDQIVMAGFGLAQLEKYTKKLQEHGYTIVVYKQDIQGKNTTRSLSEIISPGTYFSHDSIEMSNNTLCIWLHKSNATKYSVSQMTVGISNINIFTGKTSLFQYSIEYNHNPSTYDELERYIAIYKPNECLLIANIQDNLITDIIEFIGLECKKIHRININEQQDNKQDNKNKHTENTNINKNKKELFGMNKFAKNAEKQIYQQEVFKKFYPDIPIETLTEHFPTHFIATQSLCFLLDFVYQHSPNLVRKLSEPLFENHTDKLILANHSLRQLNIIDDTRHTGKLRSLSSFLNNCVTIMGKRRFLYELHNPITNISLLNTSYNITDYLLQNDILWNTFRIQLSSIKDIEKMSRKMILQKVTPKDFVLLIKDIKTISELYDHTIRDNTLTEYIHFNNITRDIKSDCLNIINNLEKIFCLEKCSQLNDVNTEYLNGIDQGLLSFINQGVNKSIDDLTQSSFDGRDKLEAIRLYFSNLLKKIEKTTKTNDFIKIHETPKNDAVLLGTSRRVTILKSQLQKMTTPKISISYISSYSNKEETFELTINDLVYETAGSNKKDLIVTNQQIKNISGDIQKSKDKLINETVTFYNNYVEDFTKYEKEIDTIIKYTILLDLLQSKCYIAFKYNYCKPLIIEDSKIENKAFMDFTELRHPLIEHLQTNELYVTNDMSIGNTKQESKSNDSKNGVLLYGTNAVGKTSYIKSLGIATIMAQAGLYVPCTTFAYYPYTAIFTRILGNDNIFKGLSTFAVEMTELRTILTMADKNSLVLGDELCSGTESDSALSIFSAGLEILHEKECTFLFATHFHEIVKYDEIKVLDKMKMMHMEVKYDVKTGALIYDRKLREGPGDSMYGLEVCKSLNLPYHFLQRAHDIRMKYKPENKNVLALETTHFNSKKIVGVCEVCNSGNQATEVHHLQHQKNANKKNDYIQSFHKNHVANLVNICETCHIKIHKLNTQHKIVKTTNGYKIKEI
jgi:DNA mismatch repair protein MutS